MIGYGAALRLNFLTFMTCFFSPFSSITMKKLKYKYYNKRITTRDKGNVHCYDQEEERKLNSTINVNSGAHTVANEKYLHYIF